MLYEHYSEYPESHWRWENFSPVELACPCCGEYYHDEESLNRIQLARTGSGKAFKINSAHRCWLNNIRVGGAPLSQHKRIAFDISLFGHEPNELLRSCKEAGFTTFGFYRSFLHTDIRPNRIWYGKGARQQWNG
ncbi:MAG: D-Ala-D-Ala carboxypeptidase family metallohydrolase [Cellvibrionaceae bacterium]